MSLVTFKPACYLCQKDLDELVVWCEDCHRIPYCSTDCEKMDLHKRICVKSDGGGLSHLDIFQRAIRHFLQSPEGEAQWTTFFNPTGRLDHRFLVVMLHDVDGTSTLSTSMWNHFSAKHDFGPREVKEKQRVLNLRIGMAARKTLVVKYINVETRRWEVHMFPLVIGAALQAPLPHGGSCVAPTKG